MRSGSSGAGPPRAVPRGGRSVYKPAIRLALVSLRLFARVRHAASPRWQKDWSKTQTAIADAEHYCKNLGPGWRLPNRAELASMLVDPNVPESKFAPTAPALPQDGYLWSDEDVSPTRQGQKWIMNLANGHIFNGSGHSGFAKCLKGTPIQEPDVPLGAPVTSIGPANAKVVSIVAMQPDYP